MVLVKMMAFMEGIVLMLLRSLTARVSSSLGLKRVSCCPDSINSAGMTLAIEDAFAFHLSAKRRAPPLCTLPPRPLRVR